MSEDCGAGVGVHETVVKSEREHVLPTGVSIRNIRQALPSTAELYVQFGLLGEDINDENVQLMELDSGGKKYRLATKIKYVVGPNPEDSEWVYLNPLVRLERVPEVSDIPRGLDQILARDGAKSRIAIVATSPDADLGDVIAQIQGHDELGYIMDKAHVAISQLDRDAILSDALEGNNVAAFAQGAGFEKELKRLMNMIAEDRLAVALSQNPDTKPEVVFFQVVTEVMGGLGNIIEDRLPQLRDLVSTNSEFAFAMDRILTNSGDNLEEVAVVTAYFPGRGWSCSIPIGNCPAQAAAQFESLLEGRLNKDDFPTFSGDIDVAESDGRLEVQKNERVIVFRDREGLDIHKGVFHGDGTLVEAMETMQMMMDPFIGEDKFKFIVFKDDSELVVDRGEPIVIDFGDLDST